MDVRIEDHTADYLSALNLRLHVALESVGTHIEGEAKEELSKPMPHSTDPSPRPYIDTCNLRNSITHEVKAEEKAVYIGTDVKYAIYIHEGTSRIKPNRFLTDAVEKNEEQIKDYLKKALG